MLTSGGSSVSGIGMFLVGKEMPITGYGHTASRPGHSTCGVARTIAHCDTAVLPV